ncbi:TKL family protein kinase [Histomonas meleagridis]|uniref:TKL family protein kinase n=1 Tax=Histomonas meleagridis TaxID=135588 RepID=UPI00355A0B64|nr:TKL family protein kinase [Histomonas meleagridis]KAH0802867.1 TKL family protein kinase [Histomonas meleagridis]
MDGSFDINQYRILRKLGKSGTIILYENIVSKKVFAFKEYFDLISISEQVEKKITEFCKINHPSIGKIIGKINPQSGHSLRLVSEYYPNGSLEDLIIKISKKNPPKWYNPTVISKIIFGTAVGLSKLHENNIIHGNLKPSNILISSDFTPKIMDISVNSITANSQYCAPEIFLGTNDYTPSIDIYSFGMLLCFIYVQESPFDESLPLVDLGDFVIDGERPILPGSIPEHIQQLIELCWSTKPSDRPTLNYLIRILSEENYLYPGTDVASFNEYKSLLLNDKPNKPQGDPERMYRYALMMKKRGTSETKHFREAARYFQAAADCGHVESMVEYGLLLQKGIGAHINLEESKKYFKMAAKNGNIDGILQYGNMLESNNEINKAAKYYKIASEKGNYEAIYKLAILGSKIGLTQKQIIENFKIAADNGIIEAAYQYALMLKETNEKESIKYFKIAADKGDGKSSFELSQLLKLKPKTNLNEIAHYLKISADNGIIKGCLQYALLLETSKIFYERLNDIIKYFKISVENGNEKIAMYQMYMFLHFGITIPKNEEEAMKMLQLSSSLSYFPALYRCALIMQYNDNVVEYRNESAKYFKKAADLNNVDAIYHYAIMKLTGCHNIRKSIKEAKKYFQIASDNNNIYALYQYVLMLFLSNDENELLIYLKKAADNGIIEAIYQYALLIKSNPKQKDLSTKYFKMISNDNNFMNDKLYLKALEFLTNKNSYLKHNEIIELFKAASKDNTNALYLYSLILQLTSSNNNNNNILSMKCLKEAADRGHVDAAYRYALIIKTGGYGIKKNLLESAFYMKKAADGGHINAMYQYALIKHLGVGVNCDDDEALIYFKMSAQNGNVDAMYQCAMMLINVDNVEARKYFVMANENVME